MIKAEVTNTYADPTWSPGTRLRLTGTSDCLSIATIVRDLGKFDHLTGQDAREIVLRNRNITCGTGDITDFLPYDCVEFTLVFPTRISFSF